MIIVGAGLAGLLAANMLSHRRPIIYEAQSNLPNNHSAVLRFRSPQIGDITHIPFRKVIMIKATIPYRNPVADALSYSYKNSGEYHSDRSINSSLSTIEERYIAPPDLIKQLAAKADIKYDTKFVYSANTTVSTIPMPALMDILKYPGPRPEFTFNPGINIIAKIKRCDAYVSLLVPDPAYPFSRISITGDELMVECYKAVVDIKKTIEDIAHLLSFPIDHFYDISHKYQRYAKINPIDDDIRKAFMFWATDKHKIFSLGRFATWRPGLLLDDLVKDLRLIDKWMSSSYSVAHHR
jgi:hypothetical protein